ncbi:MAG: putative toxin-antitoxin system toxin component, PIN family [Candidatus Kapabacteria bacterium]|nr:putative toxin-antitoxin system toxin component, PIN family [Ignavibacteriota bacterium]MCW5884602.1 putative toxin-antitoxin system toxin component, PIN family [Candidatus Kapabacteria bacterium]
MKIVIDTNILISYCLGNEDVNYFLNYIFVHKIDVYTDNRLLHEYKTIFNRKKLNLNPEFKENLLERISNYFQEIEVHDKSLKFNPDRQDSKIIEIANTANCDYIITDDKQLLRNSTHLTKAKVISSKDFRYLLENMK